MPAPAVSVLTPLLNPDPGYFRSMLRSVAEQTLGDYEHIIVEDPPTRPECEGVAEQAVAELGDDRVRLIRNPKRTSQVLQRNRAIREAQAGVIAWIDADDECAPERLEKQFGFLSENSDVDVVGCCPTIIDQTGAEIGWRPYPLEHDAIARMMPIRNPLCHPSIMVRATAIRDHGGYRDDYPRCEDYDLWCRMLHAGSRFANLADRVLRYRIHEGQIKSHSLREQLSGTIAMKSAHFRENYQLRVCARVLAERALLWFPPKLTYRLFMSTHLAPSSVSS